MLSRNSLFLPISYLQPLYVLFLPHGMHVSKKQEHAWVPQNNEERQQSLVGIKPLQPKHLSDITSSRKWFCYNCNREFSLCSFHNYLWWYLSCPFSSLQNRQLFPFSTFWSEDDTGLGPLLYLFSTGLGCYFSCCLWATLYMEMHPWD